MHELFAETIEIMLAGMGGVFLFLILLTIAVTLLTQFFSEGDASQGPNSKQASTAAGSEAASAGDQESTTRATKLAAVTVAVQKYRQARESSADQQE
ncbi:hypothetical protein CWE08_09795 [Aliidiomarina iranensis]|uniref:Oxaloacetate decarboxylase gamma chain n=1 Tax=Aliidiomarina iranensis TaxID=1434071 RepID=A0A432VSD9_9GAMM|nr:OadG family transporter subunit [Aliidiomarina iranensis]RUO19273.1 hypothetical protein CWE08_09795 [Aliidiomarina iranensis]